MRTILFVMIFSVLTGYSTFCETPASGTETSLKSFEEMLIDWAGSFLRKVPAEYCDTLNFHVKDSNSHYHLIFANGGFRLNNWKNPLSQITLTSDLDTYRRIYSGDLNAMTAAGRASYREAAPLDMILENGMTMRGINWDYAYFTMINFFNSHPSNKTLLGREHARKIHGGFAVALFYSKGFRSAFYSIQKGELLNEAGEKDPWNQSFIILSGSGFAQIGGETFPVKANEAYYIKPGVEHQVWTETEEGITLIWNAWGIEAW